MSDQALLVLALVPGFLAAFLCMFLKRSPGVARWVTLVALGISAACLGILVLKAQSGTISVVYPWIPIWNITFGLKVDAFSGFVGATVALIGFIDLIYSFGYVGPEEAKSSFFGWMALFVAAMIGVVMATDLIQFYFLWELMLIPSTALIVYWGTGTNPEATGFKYFIITHVGAVMILISFLWMMIIAGTTDLGLLSERLGTVSPGTLKAMASLLAAGFGVKMAIVPFHVWLPDAHSEAPLPVSVMLSAVMMDMGIYGMLRFLFTIFPSEVLASLSVPIMVFGVISQWYGGIEALGQTQMKRVAAYSTISQMGYVLFGIGTMEFSGISGAIFHILNHGLAKALLFMTIGCVIHMTGAHDLDETGGLAKKMPASALFGIVAAFALAGAPPLGAFQSEWRIFAGGFEAGRLALTVIAVLCSVLTAYYVLRLIIKVFFGPWIHDKEVREAPFSMLGAMAILGLLSLVIGVFPGPFSNMIESAARVLGL
ncbi:MAG TPA: NADH-quinone oxidoreductase subunit M [Firmicutes bacterium]|nr:NADH-quinone oxidoreductase subunit M [Candidatus Fermentithermobacillaceae bacterium]